MGLTVKDVSVAGQTVTIRCQDGTVTEMGAGVEAADGDEVLDGDGLALMPGLINGHTHAAMTLFRGFADDLPLMEWLENHIWPAEARLEPEDVYWGTRLACAEMIRTGTVRFWDMYWHPEAVARAVEDSGLRAVVAAPLIDGADSERSRVTAEAALDAVSASASGRVQAGFAPHAIYTVGADSLRWVAERAEERGATIQIHLSETEAEVEGCVAEHGMRPAFWLDEAGVLGQRTVLAHGVWLDEAELELIAARGATVVSNPVANLKLAVGGPFPYPAARATGVKVGLGTDGPGSNNSLDLLADMKTFALMQKNSALDAAVVTAKETLRLGQGLASDLLGGFEVGVGSAADFVLVDAGAPQLALGELDAGLVYGVGGAVVNSTIVAGEVLMRSGEMPNQEELVAKAREAAARLGIA